MVSRWRCAIIVAGVIFHLPKKVSLIKGKCTLATLIEFNHMDSARIPPRTPLRPAFTGIAASVGLIFSIDWKFKVSRSAA